MKPHLNANGAPGRDPGFPVLPILSAEEARRSTREKYGGLFYLGVGGLFLLALLLAWFGTSVWGLRSLWRHVYVMHDESRPVAERVEAAYYLAHDRHANQRQLWDVALRKPLPPLARYVVAEALTAEAASADPKGYGLSVARSEGWPGWLRLVLTRPMAYAAALGRPVAPGPLDELAANADPAVGLWASYARAAGTDDPGGTAARRLRSAAASEGPFRGLARTLTDALDAPALKERLRRLDEATVWLRSRHPEVSTLWRGWVVEGDRLKSVAAP